MKFLRSKRGAATALVVLLAALFWIRPGAEWLRARIVSSIGLALGRSVETSRVSLRLLPQPGFELENFVVHDDPAFSAEPILRAQEVSAALRLTSLLRGRLEIARLDLNEPSLNLVRDREGRWNIEGLLERAARTPVAPTGKAKTESRPGFPYIAADGGRINLKFEQEKKAYALTDADFSFWQETENAWGTRLKARPVRTDFNLTDTGLLRMNGSWQRAASLRETPLQFSLVWDGGQLGQITKLISGNDKGWRGATRVSATLTGTPADLTVQASASVQDFRRYDILGGGSMALAAQCRAHYSSVDHTISNLACLAPVGAGAVRVTGNLAGLPGLGTYDLALLAQNVPLQSLAVLARHTKKDIPDDLLASGTLSANLKVRRQGDVAAADWEGDGETLGFQLGSKLNSTQLVLGRIPFAVSSTAAANLMTRGQRPRVSSPAPEIRLSVGPFELGLGRPLPATAQAWFSRSGYSLQVQGDAQLQRLFQVARTVGVPVPNLAADGATKVDLQIAGAWAGLAAPKAVGAVQLHLVRAEVRGLNAPLEIASANLRLSHEAITVQNLTAGLGESTWHGSLVLPRPCTPGACPIRFDLRADEISTDELSQLLSPRPRQRPWYRFLSPSPVPGTTYLATLQASGKLTASRVQIDKLVASKVSASVDLEAGKLRLTDLRGDVLGGKHVGEWKADFTARPPEYSGSGTLERVALAQLAEAMHDAWITGAGKAKYRAAASGLTRSELLASASGTLQVEARDGAFPHIVLGEIPGHLRIHRLAARLMLRDSKLEVQEGKLETPGGIYQLSGTATLGRALDLKLARGVTHGFNISGTLTQPRVVQATFPETQAALKP
ncbi:MAG TPA: AsmA family protein [Aggregatilineaceae bacterium]|nr:AsmA family protein [Aggregatilineaceae bacterium]